MRNKETGEFELVVGNGQLVSGFFIVILLFAVGVAMGYILGQNSEKSAKSQQAEAAPCVATDRPQPGQPLQQASAPPQKADPQPEAGSNTPTTQPAKDPEPAPTAPAAAAKPDPPKPDPPKPSPPKPAPPSSEPPAGFYWQVTAKANVDSAKATTKTLRDRGFTAWLSPGPNNLTRVLVGPFSDTQSKAKAKTELEAMGFKGAFPYNRE